MYDCATFFPQFIKDKISFYNKILQNLLGTIRTEIGSSDYLPQHRYLVIVVLVPSEPVIPPGELEPHDDGHNAVTVQVHPGGGNTQVH